MYNLSIQYLSWCQKQGGAIIRGGAIFGGNTVSTICFTSTLQFDLPDYDKVRREAGMSIDERRAKMKKDGIVPPRSGPLERNISLACTGK